MQSYCCHFDHFDVVRYARPPGQSYREDIYSHASSVLPGLDCLLTGVLAANLIHEALWCHRQAVLKPFMQFWCVHEARYDHISHGLVKRLHSLEWL